MAPGNAARSLVPVPLSAALLLLGLVSGCGGPPAEDPRTEPAPTTIGPPPEPLSYVALGDSYTAGVGAGQGDDDCGQTTQSYPELLDQRTSIELTANASCGGATTADVVREQTQALSADTDLVTITIGGNDLGFGEAAGRCSAAPASADCAASVENALTLAENRLPEDLETTFAAIRNAAPEAHVVVLGYPLLFSPQFGQLEEAAEAATDVNDTVELLNRTIAESAGGHEFQYVDVRDEFRDHGVGSPQPWVHASEPAPFHPTADGYRQGYLPAFDAEVDLRALHGP